jgi:hypothetical protein
MIIIIAKPINSITGRPKLFGIIKITVKKQKKKNEYYNKNK